MSIFKMQRSFGACCRSAASTSVTARACKCKSFVSRCCLFPTARHASSLADAASLKPRPVIVAQPTITAAGVAGAVPVTATAAPIEVYMKELPPSCIDWSTDDGRTLFREALLQGNMECYFPLAAQFTTQAEPAYCGLGTLAMVLNALNIDPGRVWKGIWRWYHEGMLDCCVPLDVVQQKGISMDTFACLARCNGAAATVARAAPDTQSAAVQASSPEEQDRGLFSFRAALRSAVRNRAGAFLVASYSRKALGQTGDGHFSPLAGYHEGRDMVLVLDVARFKYPPHWVSVVDLYKAMQRLDPDTGRPRGYVTVHRSAAVPLVLFAFGQTHGHGSHTHSHGHVHMCQGGACCSAPAMSEGAGSTNGIAHGAAGHVCGSNCSGQGQSMSGAAAQLMEAIRAIDATVLYLSSGGSAAAADVGHSGPGRPDAGHARPGQQHQDALVDKAIRTGVRILLASGEAAVTDAADEEASASCGHGHGHGHSHGHGHNHGGAASSSPLAVGEAALGLPLHVHAGTPVSQEPPRASSTPGRAPLLALSSSGDGLSLANEATCLTRLSREQVGAAASLLQDVEILPLYGAVRRALEWEARRRAKVAAKAAAAGAAGQELGHRAGPVAGTPLNGTGAAGSDPTVATLSSSEPSPSSASPSCLVYDEGEEDDGEAWMDGAGARPGGHGDDAGLAGAGSPRVPCAQHGPQSCVRVHTAHVLTTLLLTMYAPAPAHDLGHVGPGLAGLPGHAGQAGLGTAAHPVAAADVIAAGGTADGPSPRSSAGSVLRSVVSSSLACASPLVRAEVNLLRGQLLDDAASMA